MSVVHNSKICVWLGDASFICPHHDRRTGRRNKVKEPAPLPAAAFDYARQADYVRNRTLPWKLIWLFRLSTCRSTAGFREMVLSPQAAQLLTDATKLLGIVAVWMVTDADHEHRDKFVARAYTADFQGRVYSGGALIANSLLELRMQMPAGLMPWTRDPYHSHRIIEVWE